tara:strand:+ start:351 stop:1238 length:888 start_codon:yes stop_codon:yes gene_type:complete
MHLKDNKYRKFDLIIRFIELTKEKQVWGVEELCTILGIENDDFDYLINIISDLYTSNDLELFFDIEVTSDKVRIELNDIVKETQLITDYEFISLYNVLINLGIDTMSDHISQHNISYFLNCVSDYIQVEHSSPENKHKIDSIYNDAEEIILEYSPLGEILSKKYHIKPISLVNNNEGVALLAFDKNSKQNKTFLINRFIDVSYNISEYESKSLNKMSEEYNFSFKFVGDQDDLVSIDLDSIVEEENETFSITFRNKNIALEFYKRNINKILSVNNEEFEKEIKSSFNKVINLVGK